MTKSTINWTRKRKEEIIKKNGTTEKYKTRTNTSYKLNTEQPELDAKGKKRLAEILAQYPMIIE